MDESALLETNVHERTEWNDVEDGTAQFHARLDVLQLQHALLENWRG